MKKSLVKNYETIANAFKVIDISNPIYLISKPEENSIDVVMKLTEPSNELLQLIDNDINQEEIWREMDKIEDRFCIVRDRTQSFGYIEMTSNFDKNKTAKDIAKYILPEKIVPGNMSIIDLIPLFKNSYYFFVLVGNKIDNVVTFSDIDKLPVKLSLFSLFMQFESELIDFLINDPKKNKIFVSILKNERPTRYDKAIDLCKIKYGNNITNKNLIFCTTFIDKKFILEKDGELFHKLFSNKKEADHFFNILEKVRNQIAHSDSIVTILKNPVELINFLDILKNIILNLKNR